MKTIADRIDLLGFTDEVNQNTMYTEEDMLAVIARIANGETLLRICNEPDQPSREVFRYWRKQNPELDKLYEEAKLYRTEHLADEILDIADETKYDTKINKQGDEVADAEWIARSNIRVKVRQWLLERTNPKVYGNKTSTEVTGPEGTPLIPEVTDTDIARRVAFILQTGLNNMAFDAKEKQ